MANTEAKIRFLGREFDPQSWAVAGLALVAGGAFLGLKGIHPIPAISAIVAGTTMIIQAGRFNKEP